MDEGKEFGKGWISGTASVSLAAIGLLAVFYFHFPSYLTIPDVRAYYPVPRDHAASGFGSVLGASALPSSSLALEVSCGPSFG